MTTRLFAVISGLCLLSVFAVSLALLPEILGASTDTVRTCRGIALAALVFGGPLVCMIGFATWIWEVSRNALTRRAGRG